MFWRVAITAQACVSYILITPSGVHLLVLHKEKAALPVCLGSLALPGLDPFGPYSLLLAQFLLGEEN